MNRAPSARQPPLCGKYLLSPAMPPPPPPAEWTMRFRNMNRWGGGEGGGRRMANLCLQRCASREGEGESFSYFILLLLFFRLSFFFFFCVLVVILRGWDFCFFYFSLFFSLPPRWSNETILGTKKSLRFYYVSLLIAFGSRVAFLCYYFVLIISISFLSSFFSSFSSFGNVFGIGGILCNRWYMVVVTLYYYSFIQSFFFFLVKFFFKF